VNDKHIRILNLEDRAIDADLIERELKRANLDVSVTRVETESAFRAALETSPPDVILADYNLPAFDGIGALKIARAIAPDIPFIFVSGSIGEERATQALREGATDYVIKDRLSRLPSAVTRALAEKKEREERERTQQALARSDERFQHAARATLEVIWDWDLATNRVSFNEALRSVWGYTLPDDTVDLEWWAGRIHPDDRAAILDSVKVAIEREDRWSGEYRFQRADGFFGHVLDRAVIVRDQHGQPYRMICAMLDITEQMKADERVRESELRFRSVAETATDAIVVSDLHGKIIFWNEAAARLFGYSSDEIVGNLVHTLVPERYRDAHLAGMKRYRETGEAHLAGRLLQFEGLRKDGREFPLEMSLTIWKSGEEAYCTALMRDVTVRVALERRQRVQLAVARTLAGGPSIAAATTELLHNVGSELGWQVGFCWRHDAEADGLRCTDAWSAPGFTGREFIDLSKRLVLGFGQGLPGLVSLKNRAIAVDPMQPYANAEQYPRARIAWNVGIKHGVSFPIVEHGAVTAIMEFFDTTATVDDDDFLELMTDVGQRIGEFFERRRAEENLLQSEASLAEAQEMAKLGSFMFDMASGRVEWSDQTYRIFGLERQQFGGTIDAYLARVHPDDVTLVRSITTPPLSDVSLHFSHRIVCPDGEVRFVDCRARVVEGSARAPEKLLGTLQDVTEQIASQEKIQRLSHQNEMILNYAGEAILGIDGTGRVTFANPAAVAFTGWSAEELLSAPSIHTLIHHSHSSGEPYDEQNCALMQGLRDGSPRFGEETFWRKSGDSFPAQYSLSPITEGSRVGGAVLVFDDVGERRRLEHQLEQANRVSGLGRVAATIAHEFNNVLMGIQPFAEVIRRRSSDEKTLKAAAQITSSVTRGKRVTQEILRFTQPAEPALQPVPCGEWLKNLLPELQSLVGASVAIELVLPPEDIVVRGDPSQLQQVITNLVLNARDAMAGRGVVTITVTGSASGREFSFGRIPEGLMLMTVCDTGSGMTPNILENIFEPLFTTKRTGTGLGLAVVQQVIRRHGGSIHAESKVDEGTTFFILLPTASPTKPLVAVPENHDARHGLQRIVLVEDEPAVATGLTLLLEIEGVAVRVAERGGLALDVIHGFNPDAVILDMSLPDMLGTEVFELIAARYPALPILFSSGHGDETSVERYLSNDHVGFLRKPYNFSARLDALDRITRDARRIDA
jgi:PAS domain S-box-containing protein